MVGYFPTRILFATDGSQDAALARRAAVDICSRSGSELHVAHTWGNTAPYAAPATGLDYHERRAQDFLLGQLDELEGVGAVVSGSHLKRGRPAEEIAALAEELDAGLLVLGSRGLGVVERLVLGSVSEGVVSLSKRPTLVMRGGEGNWPPGAIVVGDDTSEESRKASEIALSLGALFGSEALLVRAAFPPPSYPTSEWSRQNWRERETLAREQELHRVESALRGRADRLGRESGLRPEVLAVAGEAAPAVLGVAEKAGEAALIAVGRRGLGKVQSMVLGSVSTKVLRASRGPVLVCR